MAERKGQGAKKSETKAKGAAKKAPPAGQSAGAATGSAAEADPFFWDKLFTRALEKAKAEVNPMDLERFFAKWFSFEAGLIDENRKRDDFRALLLKTFDLRTQGLIYYMNNSRVHLTTFFQVIAEACEASKFKLHPWVMTTHAAMAVESAHMSGLGYWLYAPPRPGEITVSPEVDNFISLAVSGALTAIGSKAGA